MTAAGQFLVTCTVFHAGIVGLAVWSGRAWLVGRDWRTHHRVRSIMLGTGGLLVAIAAWAVLCSLIGPRSGFTIIRLISQALFSEVLLLSVFVAAAEYRSSPTRALAGALVPLGLLGTYWEAYHREPTAL